MNRSLRVLSVVLLSTFSACTGVRTAVIEGPAPRVEPVGPILPWTVGDVVARAAQPGASAELSTLKAQIEGRLRSTLQAQSALGHRLGAPVKVSVECTIAESAQLNGWFGLGVGLEAAVLSSGAGVGFLLGGPPGSLIGLGLAVPVALAAAMAPPGATELGELEVVLTVREGHAEQPLAVRHVRQAYSAITSVYTSQAHLARISGEAVIELERKLLAELADVLADEAVSRGGVAPAAVPVVPSP